MPVTYIQPTSATDTVLGNKCFVYSTLNALAHCAIALPAINATAGATPQLQADNWIRAQAFSGVGGGPGVVLKALNLTPKELAVQFTDHVLTRATYASQNNLPVIVATSVGAQNHWIFLTGVTATAIQAEDQQNPARGTLTFTKNASNVYTAVSGTTTYTLNNINVFITASAQRDAMTAL